MRHVFRPIGDYHLLRIVFEIIGELPYHLAARYRCTLQNRQDMFSHPGHRMVTRQDNIERRSACHIRNQCQGD